MKIIVNADDFGSSRSINEAISLAFSYGYIQRTSIMVNMPSFEEGILISKNNKFFDKVGLHLTLDDGEPLTQSMRSNSHFCQNGKFIKSNIKGIRKIVLSRRDRKCLECEVEAQMKRYIDAGFELMHIDSHHHVHTNYSVMRIVKKVSKKYGFVSCRASALLPSDGMGRRLYRWLFNKWISKSFLVVPLFKREEHIRGHFDNAELMTHPDLINDRLVNVINRTPLSVSDFVDHKCESF